MQTVKFRSFLNAIMKTNYLLKVKEETSRKEINSISSLIDVADRASFSVRAEEIASIFLQSNNLINPITLARSSCYIALTEISSEPETQIETIRNNNGRENKWFMHLVPMIEKELPK